MTVNYALYAIKHPREVLTGGKSMFEIFKRPLKGYRRGVFKKIIRRGSHFFENRSDAFEDLSHSPIGKG
jgi:hypothetical protein